MSDSLSIFDHVALLEKSGNAGALCTVVASHGSTPRGAGAKMLVYNDGSFIGTVGGGELENRVRKAAFEAMESGKTRLLSYNMTDIAKGDPGVCGGQVEVFVEPILPAPTVLVIGGGHVGKAVAHLAKWLGFHVVVSDDRVEFCTPEANPDADAFLPIPMAEIRNQFTISKQTYLILTTRGTNVDVIGMPALLDSPAAYIGVIGSQRRWATTVKELKRLGVPDKALRRVHSPIGLELGAETPEEIAVSILAEILMLRDGGTGKAMKMNTRGR